MSAKVVWAFIAGESRLAPLCVVLAIVTANVVLRYLPGGAAFAGITFVAVLALGLVAGVFEKG